jgi:hypothetical protein
MVQFREQVLDVEGLGHHGEFSVLGTRPLFLGAVPVQLDAVVVWVPQVQSL